MVNSNAGDAPRRLTGIAVTVAVVAALGVYQATSLVLGPRADRQIAVSLSPLSGSDEVPLPPIPVVLALQLGQVAVASVEKSPPSQRSGMAAATVRHPVQRTIAVIRVTVPAPVAVPVLVTSPPVVAARSVVVVKSSGHAEGQSQFGTERSTGSRQDGQIGD